MYTYILFTDILMIVFTWKSVMHKDRNSEQLHRRVDHICRPIIVIKYYRIVAWCALRVYLQSYPSAPKVVLHTLEQCGIWLKFGI